ncbi:polysaccharide biosynthesis tyrosine autokinase [Nocardioides fonticola]|uniref:non-specific protein-tyrosine kinase n=1 Tax=Nocardioides fonticola TaxID=450363 RepID=A0ABP7XEM0_9ACTN
MIEFLRLIGHRWRVIVATVVLAVSGASLYTYLTPPTYTATTELFVAIGNSSGDDSASGIGAAVFFVNSRVKSYPDLVKSPLVLDPVIKELGLDTTSSALADDVTASVADGTVLMDVSVSSESASQAATIANATGKQMVSIVEDLDRSSTGTSPVKVTVVRPATVPTSPTKPVPWLNVLIGLFAGLGLGLAFAALRETLDTSVKSDTDVTEAVDLPTLSMIPTNPQVSSSPLVSAGGANPVWAESYRRLRTNLSYLDPDRPHRSLLVTSSLPGDGKTLTACNLAATIAQSQKRCVLVEADLRRPTVSRILGLTPDVGVTNVVTGNASIEDVVQHADGFDVITGGPIPPNPSELLGSQAFNRMIQSLLARYDNVVIDTPPMLAVTDAAVAATSVDAVILVAQAKRTRKQELRKALDGLDAVDANVVGVVLNRMPAGSGGYYEYEYRPTTGKRVNR